MPFDYQPTLKGKLVEVRPLRPDDYAELYAVASDPLIWEQHPDRTRYQPAGFAAFFRESLAAGGALFVTDAATQRAIGSSRFFAHGEETSEVEIGWTFLARSHWGGAYNADLKQVMMRHAFRFVNSVVLFVSPGNVRSQRAVAKIGGLLEAEPDAAGRLVYRVTASALQERDGRSGALRSLVALLLFIAGCSDQGTFSFGGELASPDGSLVATFHALGGGGAAGWVSESVTMRQADTPFDRSEARALWMGRAYEVCLHWESDDHLSISIPSGAIVHEQKASLEIGRPIAISVVRLPGRWGQFDDGCPGAKMALEEPAADHERD